MTSNNLFVKYWRILLIIFIIFTSSIQELRILNFDVGIIINKEVCVFVECLVGVLTSSLLLCAFIYLLEKNYKE
jgi:hypothetical protein